jgi:hypothetical protein
MNICGKDGGIAPFAPGPLINTNITQKTNGRNFIVKKQKNNEKPALPLTIFIKTACKSGSLTSCSSSVSCASPSSEVESF